MPTVDAINAVQAAATAAAFEHVGNVEVTVNAGPAFQALIERNVSVLDAGGVVVERQTRLTVRKLDADLNEGDTISDGTDTWTVDALIADDGLKQTAALI